MSYTEQLGALSMAVHEAAHAVVAWRCGLRVESLKLEYGWWSGSLQGGFTRVRGDFSEEESLSWAATIAAGSLAQERFLVARGTDVARASRIAAYSASLDADDLTDLVRDFGVSASAARLRAETLIDRHWSQILEVGVLLDDRGRVSGARAR